MSDIETITTCPLGSECRKIVDGKIHQCAWYVSLKGNDPQDGSPISESRCAIAWQPLLMVEGSRETSRVAASVQSLRNETVIRQDRAIEVMKGDVRTISDT